MKTKTLVRGIGLAFLVGSSLALAGCGADNESEASRLQKKVGEIPKTDVKGGEVLPQPKTQAELAAQRQEAASKDLKSSEYYKNNAGGGGGRR